MKNSIYMLLSVLVVLFSACDKKNDNLISPLVEGDFPQILMLADEGDGELEEEDKFSFVITLADRKDPEGKELGGTVIPLKEDVTVYFEVSGDKTFSPTTPYILAANAFYEIDDCTTSEDEDVDLNVVYDALTRKGSVTFPKGVTEIEVEFETNPDLVSDDLFNTESRNLEIKLTSVDANSEHVVVNQDNSFQYMILDEEGVYGEYELSVNQPAELAKYLALFGLVNEDVKALKADEVKEIIVEFQYGEFKAVVVLNETEEVDDCGSVETINKEIEIEGEFEELDDDQQEGELEFVGAVEQEDGSEKEFVYKGSFKIDGDRLALLLQGQFNDVKTAEITLNLKK
jgi:hypothetical protein